MLALVVAAAQTCTALAAYRVNFVDKDNTGRIFLRLLEHIADAACTDTDEHFDKIGTGNAEERHAGFACNGFCQQGFTRTRAARQQDAARHATAEALIAVRRFEVIDDFLHFFFGFVAACDIGKGNFVGIFVQQACAAFSE